MESIFESTQVNATIKNRLRKDLLDPPRVRGSLEFVSRTGLHTVARSDTLAVHRSINYARQFNDASLRTPSLAQEATDRLKGDGHGNSLLLRQEKPTLLLDPRFPEPPSAASPKSPSPRRQSLLDTTDAPFHAHRILPAGSHVPMNFGQDAMDARERKRSILLGTPAASMPVTGASRTLLGTPEPSSRLRPDLAPSASQRSSQHTVGLRAAKSAHFGDVVRIEIPAAELEEAGRMGPAPPSVGPASTARSRRTSALVDAPGEFSAAAPSCEGSRRALSPGFEGAAEVPRLSVSSLQLPPTKTGKEKVQLTKAQLVHKFLNKRPTSATIVPKAKQATFDALSRIPQPSNQAEEELLVLRRLRLSKFSHQLDPTFIAKDTIRHKSSFNTSARPVDLSYRTGRATGAGAEASYNLRKATLKSAAQDCIGDDGILLTMNNALEKAIISSDKLTTWGGRIKQPPRQGVSRGRDMLSSKHDRIKL